MGELVGDHGDETHSAVANRALKEVALPEALKKGRPIQAAHPRGVVGAPEHEGEQG